jgi:hypothetical protein
MLVYKLIYLNILTYQNTGETGVKDFLSRLVASCASLFTLCNFRSVLPGLHGHPKPSLKIIPMANIMCVDSKELGSWMPAWRGFGLWAFSMSHGLDGEECKS